MADTGCSVNILPARFAAIAGLKLQEVDKDESTFNSATNHELTIVKQTTMFVKLDTMKYLAQGAIHCSPGLPLTDGQGYEGDKGEQGEGGTDR